jgi:hypothetical protein
MPIETGLDHPDHAPQSRRDSPIIGPYGVLAEHRLSQAAARMSEAAFARVWDNPEDAAYDAL